MTDTPTTPTDVDALARLLHDEYCTQHPCPGVSRRDKEKAARWIETLAAARPVPQPTGTSEEECDVPPSGWSCSRAKGHDGPCAATAALPSVPTPTVEQVTEVIANRLGEHKAARRVFDLTVIDESVTEIAEWVAPAVGALLAGGGLSVEQTSDIRGVIVRVLTDPETAIGPDSDRDPDLTFSEAEAQRIADTLAPALVAGTGEQS